MVEIEFLLRCQQQKTALENCKTTRQYNAPKSFDNDDDDDEEEEEEESKERMLMIVAKSSVVGTALVSSEPRSLSSSSLPLSSM